VAEGETVRGSERDEEIVGDRSSGALGKAEAGRHPGVPGRRHDLNAAQVHRALEGARQAAALVRVLLMGPMPVKRMGGGLGGRQDASRHRSPGECTQGEAGRDRGGKARTERRSHPVNVAARKARGKVDLMLKLGRCTEIPRHLEAATLPVIPVATLGDLRADELTQHALESIADFGVLGRGGREGASMALDDVESIFLIDLR
jgi:hypothetical protein